MTDAEYNDWLTDVRYNSSRVLLIIASHSAGEALFASQPYISKTAPFDAFDDFLLDVPIIDKSIDSVTGVGDFTVTAGNTIGLGTNEWRGHDVLFYYGDISWGLVDFRVLATGVIDSVDYEGHEQWTFRLFDYQKLYDKQVTTTESKTDTVANILNWIETAGGYASVGAVNLSASELATELSINVEADKTKWRDVLDIVAISVGGYWRINRLGNAEVITQSATTAMEIDSDDIIAGSIRQFNSIPAMSGVDHYFNWSGGYDVPSNDPDNPHSTDSSDTLADTGSLSERVTLNSAITTLIDAQNVTNKHILARSQVQREFELEVTGKAMVVEVGDTVNIESGVLSGAYLVTRVKLSPTDLSSLIEVRK